MSAGPMQTKQNQAVWLLIVILAALYRILVEQHNVRMGFYIHIYMATGYCIHISHGFLRQQNSAKE